MWPNKNGKSEEPLDSKKIHLLRMNFIGQIVDRFGYRENKLQADKLKGYLTNMGPGEEIDFYFSRMIYNNKMNYHVQGRVEGYYVKEYPKLHVSGESKIPEEAKRMTLMMIVRGDMDKMLEVPCIEMDVELTEKVRKGELD